MIKFNPENKQFLTMGQCAGPAMGITDPLEAKQYLEDYISWIEQNNAWSKENCSAIILGDFTTSEQMAKRSLGYYAGYCDDETRERIERLFDCEHHIFGKLSEMGKPTSDESFQCGLQRKTLAEIRKQNKK